MNIVHKLYPNNKLNGKYTFSILPNDFEAIFKDFPNYLVMINSLSNNNLL